jgi:dipeptidyl aminopeptidase/acylaminoacyl peptidase
MANIILQTTIWSAPRAVSRKFLKAVRFGCVALAAYAPCLAQTSHHLAPEDLLRVKNITDVALSPDGHRVIFVAHEASLLDDRYKSSLWMASVDGPSPPHKLLDDGYSAQWSSDGKRLACIRPREGRPQIAVLRADTLDILSDSSAPTGVVSFQWSPNGSEIAFLSREADVETTKPGDRKGAVIDKRAFNVYKLLGNDLFLDLGRPVHLYLLHVESKSSEKLIDSFHVDAVAWAPDGRSIAITGKESPELGYPTSVYLYSLASKKATRILEGAEHNRFPTLEYTQPTWSPDGSELAAVSKTSEDRWANGGSIGIYSVKTSRFRLITDENHLELYGPRFFWREKAGLILENTVRAKTELFRLSKDGSVQPLTSFGGDSSSFSLSASGDEISFVHDDVQHPPEVQIARAPFTSSNPVTTVNGGLASLPSPESERVHWKGAGGVEVEGLLLKPANYRPGRRYPLLVMVHGGPGVAIKDAFEPYSLFGQWAWPYPFRIFADRGYLIFIPNYRGTGSYGKSFRLFRDMAGEPAEDIVSGIEFLKGRGDADPNLIGILGQSHGAWLGPYVLTHHKEMFKAASFAEGALDAISQYGVLPGWLNLYTHEFYNPGTPYENTQRYIAISPIFAMKGLETPTMLEFGQRSLAMLGLESLTALWREGVPHEMVIYPKEGHNLSSPVLQLESIGRNLDWFDYWMFGKKNPDPKKQEQYARWENMAREMKQVRDDNAKSGLR